MQAENENETRGETIIRFQGKIARSGSGRYFIYVPKALSEMISPYLNKKVIITIEKKEGKNDRSTF